jgi:hypothetical protein
MSAKSRKPAEAVLAGDQVTARRLALEIRALGGAAGKAAG